MDEDPISYPQAMKSKESSQWYEAMVQEMNSLKKKQNFRIGQKTRWHKSHGVQMDI